MGTNRLAIALVKALRKPVLKGKPKPGKWYRIPLPQCRAAGRIPVHTCIRKGTENKLIVFLQGGGVSWNAYMAARPNSPYLPKAEEDFYSIDSYLISDLVMGMGFMDQGKDNPFRSWSAVGIPYSTGDFHCGTGDFPYTDLNGEKKILPHHGLLNVLASIDTAMNYLPAEPETLMIAGFSAGGFGTSIIADEIIRRFPSAKEVICYNDSGFMIYPGWHEAAKKVWKAPQRICDRIVSDNISLDCLKALHRDYGDRVKILFSCSVRDVALSSYWNYIDGGRIRVTAEAGAAFQNALKEMVNELCETIPNAAIFLFDTPDGKYGKDRLTAHCIGASPAVRKVVVDGKSCFQWIVDATNGSGEKLGLSLLEQ